MTKSAKKLIAIILAAISVVSVFGVGFAAIANAAGYETDEEFEEIYSNYDTEKEAHLIELNWYNCMKSGIGTFSKITTKSPNEFGSKTYVDSEDGTVYNILTPNNTTVIINAINTPLDMDTFVVPKYVSLYQLAAGGTEEYDDDYEPMEGEGVVGTFVLGNDVETFWDFSDEKTKKTRTVEEYDYEKENFVKKTETYYVCPSVSGVSYRYAQVVGVNQSFSGDKNPELKTVLFPEDLRTIDASAFASNQYIENVYAPDVTEVKDKSFYDCKELTNCVLPSVRYVGKTAFYKDNRLRDFNFESCLKIGEQAFFDCVRFKTIEFSPELQELGNGAFKQCTGLTEIVIPNGVSINTIPKECFYLCTSLESIEFSSEIINIGALAFFNCSSLKFLDLRESNLEKIESKAFWGCTGLEYVILPKSIVSFATDSFEKCDELRYVCFTGKLTDAQIKKIQASDLGSCTITKVDTEGPALYNTETKQAVKGKEVKFSEPVELILFDAIDIVEAYINDEEIELELSSEPNGYRTYVGYLDISDPDEYEIRAIDFFGNESVLKVIYSEDPITYTVKFDGNGAENGKMNDLNCEGEDKYTLPSNQYTKTGYTFAGWSLDKSSQTTDYSDKDTVSGLTSVDEDVVTLYAVWKPNECEIRFDPNGGNNGMNNVKFTFGKAVTLPGNAYTKIGYTFSGWATEKDGVVKYDNKAKITPDKLTDDNTLVLYAVWQPNKYTVKFNANGGKGEMEAINAEYDKEFTVPKNEFTKEGYTFNGWNAKTTLTSRYVNDQETVKNLVSSANGAITLYAVWKNNGYTVVMHSNDGTDRKTEQAFTIDKKTSLNYNSYTRTGYTFKGWSTTESGDVIYKNGASLLNVVGSDETYDLYAVWEANQYTIVLNGNGSKNVVLNNKINAVYNQSVKLSANEYYRPGYLFGGWSTKANTAALFKDQDEIKNLAEKGTVNLYVIWDKVMMGDVDGDGEVTPADARTVLRMSVLLDEYEMTGLKYAAGDVDKDGKITPSDARTILRVSVRLEKF